MTLADLESLRHLAVPKYRNTLEWWGSFTEEEQELLSQVILNYPAPTVVDALRENADYPFSITSLKALRETLRKDMNG